MEIPTPFGAKFPGSLSYEVLQRFLGYWFVHCHVGNHQAEGMALMFNESFAHQPPAPPGFPTCQNFGLDQTGFRAMLERNKKCLNDEKCSRVQAFENKEKEDCQVSLLFMSVSLLMMRTCLLAAD
jgi:hypothetical protein